MACQRSPPSSPRAPKIQQESWDDCDSPPIDLFNPCHHNPPRSPTRVQPPPKSPKSPRKFNKPIISQTPPYCDARNSSKSSSRSSFHSSGSNTDQRSPKYPDNPPRSPKITTTYANDDNNDDDDDDDNDNVIIDNQIVDLDIESTTGSFYQTPPTGSRSPKPSSSSGTSSYYYDQQQQQSPRRSPKSPRKFVFDAISPIYESKGRNFEYFDPTSLDINPADDADIESIDQEESNNRYVRTHPLSSRCQTPPKSSSTSLLSLQLQQQQQQQPLQQSQQCPIIPPPPSSSIPNSLLHQRRESKNFNKNFAGILSSLSSSNSGNKIITKDKIGMSLNHCGGLGNNNNSGNNNRYHRHHSSQQHHPVQQTTAHLLDEFPSGNRSNLYVKRDSCMTESTQLSGDSCETNATTLTTTTTFISSSADEGQIIETQSSPIGVAAGTGAVGCNRSGINSPVLITSNSGQVSPKCQTKGGGTIGGNDKGSSGRKDLGKRRHAINITSNPSYQVLHGSHSTLDRTCSDSVVSLKYRKSTSDLTDVDDGAAPIVTKNRRRGSSKGGLAYLASRRSSRDSIKSNCSNTSNFSNEDIGPLAFQASSRSRQRRTSNFLELPIPDHIRPRVCSLPDRPYNPRLSDDLYRLRHFSISKGTVVNCGDSIISRRSRSNTSVNSTTSRASERSPFEGSCCGGGYANVDSMPPSPSDSEPPPPPRYRIVMLGDAGVGKTALVSQFMTSEYMHTYDASLDDEFGEKTVSVLLDDEESELVFIDHPSVEMSVENSLTTYEPHACVVIYSVVDRNSFRVAEEIVNYLWSESITKEKAVILVGNKADLARSRVITMSEGKSLAASRDAKFIETSSGIQHNVDELLVGILKQMRLKERRDKKAAQTSSKMKNSRTQISLHLAKEILQKICLSDITKSKSCENLHVL